MLQPWFLQSHWRHSRCSSQASLHHLLEETSTDHRFHLSGELSQTNSSSSFSRLRLEEHRSSRWWRSKMWRSPSSPEIHLHVEQLLQNTSECWQKNSDFPKDVLRQPTRKGEVKSEAEHQELCEQSEREISPSSIRRSRLNLHNQLDLPCISGIPE